MRDVAGVVAWIREGVSNLDLGDVRDRLSSKVCNVLAGEIAERFGEPGLCGIYLGDNDATCPQLTCVRDKGHPPPCDNVRGDARRCSFCGEPLDLQGKNWESETQVVFDGHGVGVGGARFVKKRPGKTRYQHAICGMPPEDEEAESARARAKAAGTGDDPDYAMVDVTREPFGDNAPDALAAELAYLRGTGPRPEAIACESGGRAGRDCTTHGLPLYPDGLCNEGRRS